MVHPDEQKKKAKVTGGLPLLTKPKHKKETNRGWKQRQVTQEKYRDTA